MEWEDRRLQVLSPFGLRKHVVSVPSAFSFELGAARPRRACAANMSEGTQANLTVRLNV